MRIQHNIPAMNAYRNYNSNVKSLQANLQKLSSGYRINKAGDDAAGLAISEKMRAQITGLEVAQKNAKDGISLVQTAEGAMTEVHDMLNRMYELAEQSANGTYADKVDREQMQKEIVSLRTEIDRIADSTNFNGLNLLDGSLADGSTRTVIGKDIAAACLNIPTTTGVDPDDIASLGVKTFLHQDGVQEQQTVIQAEFHNKAASFQKGDKIKLTVGTDQIAELEIVGDDATEDLAAGKVYASTVASTEKIVDALLAATGGTAGAAGTPGTATIGGQAFDVEKSSVNGNFGLKFTQTDAPKDSTEVVNAGLAVKIDFTPNASPDPAKVEGTPATSVVAAWTNATATATGGTTGITAAAITQAGSGAINLTESWNATGLTAAINQAKPSYAAGSDAVAVAIKVKKIGGTGDDKDQLGLYVTDAGSNDVQIGISTEKFEEFTGDGSTNTTFTFTGMDGTTGLGSFTLAPNNGVTIKAAAFDTALSTVAQFTAADANATKNMDFSFTAGDTGAALATAAAGAKAESGDIVMKKDANDKLALYVGNQKISADLDASANFGQTTKAAFEDKDGNTILELDLQNVTAAGDLTSTDGYKTGLTYTVAGTAGTTSGTWNPQTTMNTQGQPKSNDQLASTSFSLDASIVKDGQTLTIGKDVYTFRVGKDSKVNANAATTINLEKFKEGDANLVSKACELLSQKSDSNQAFSIGWDGATKLTIHEKIGQSAIGADKLSSVTEFQKWIHANEAGGSINGKALTLQIGDTSEDFNKIAVDIKDMHADAMGIGAEEVDISTQPGASKAMDAIKSAINYVSDVRGDLGATQNRLDHTINNLSVAQENIQDAESTIRDVDVAEEMMAYTKNNILVQAAQAMLAQANQLPQGVLQLLG